MAAPYTKKPMILAKPAMLPVSCDADMYGGVMSSDQDDFTDYPGLEDTGVITTQADAQGVPTESSRDPTVWSVTLTFYEGGEILI